MIRFYQFTTLALGIACMTSCMTIDKAKRTLDKHPESAAQYCADKFPVKTDSVVNEQIDERIKEQEEAQRVRDSLLNLADGRNKTIDQLIDQLDSVKAGAYFDIESLQARIRSLTTNTAAIRTRTNTVIKEVVKPCSTKTVTITKENTARVEAFRIGMERVQRESDGWKEKAQKRGKMMWSLALLVFIYIALRVVKATWLRWLPIPLVVLGMVGCSNEPDWGKAYYVIDEYGDTSKYRIGHPGLCAKYDSVADKFVGIECDTIPDTIFISKTHCHGLLPDGYELLANPYTSEYVIKREGYYIGDILGVMNYPIEGAKRFIDSCAAKEGAWEAKEYQEAVKLHRWFEDAQLKAKEEMRIKRNTFKPIKKPNPSDGEFIKTSPEDSMYGWVNINGEWKIKKQERTKKPIK